MPWFKPIVFFFFFLQKPLDPSFLFHFTSHFLQIVNRISCIANWIYFLMWSFHCSHWPQEESHDTRPGYIRQLWPGTQLPAWAAFLFLPLLILQFCPWLWHLSPRVSSDPQSRIRSHSPFYSACTEHSSCSYDLLFEISLPFHFSQPPIPLYTHALTGWHPQNSSWLPALIVTARTRRKSQSF